MYNDFFGFRERPFNVTPDPRVFYATPSCERIYNNLVHSILEGNSLTVLTGEVGTGKTTILRRIMRELERFARFAYFTYTTLPFEDLLDFICEDLEIPRQHGGQLQSLKALQETLVARQNSGQSSVLLIDEAQNLQEDVLEEIRHLLNLTTENKALLPVILVGQPELERKLALPALHQLKQRVTIHCQLDRLKEREVGPFIAHRLQVAGCPREDVFDADAIQHIAMYSQGVPRLINILCDNALLLGYSIAQQTISADMVEEVAQDLGLRAEPSVAGEKAVVAQEKPAVPVDVLPSIPLQSEEQLTNEEPVPVTQLQAPIQPTDRVLVSMTNPPSEKPLPRIFSRQFAWAGAGLALALLWSFTFFPDSRSEESTASLTKSPQASSKASPPDQAKAFFGRTETESQQVRQETAPASPSTHLSTQTSSHEEHPSSSRRPTLPAPPQSPQLATQEPVLIDVASEGNQQETQRLLDAGAKPNGVDESGWTALMMATLHGHTSVVQLLLKKGADANVSNSTGGTALMMAALQGQNDILQLLLNNGAQVNTQDVKGWTALMYAARNGYASTVEILLSRGAEVNLKNNEGRTALMYATAKGHREAIDILQNGKAVSSAVN